MDVAERNHPFDLRRLDFHVNAPFRQATDVPVEHPADLVLHEFHHLIFDGGSFGIGGNLLPYRAVFAAIFVIEFVLGGRAVHIHRQQPMDHDVGITADGRSKVGIERESQSIVSYVVCGVARPGHAAQGQQLQCILLRLALGFLHQCVERRSCLLRIRGIAQFMTEILGEAAQAVEFLGIRVLVDSVNEGRILGLAFLGGILRHATVGQQHEFLDEPVALLTFFLDDIDRLACLIHEHLHLGPFKGNGALVKALLAQNGCQGMQIKHFGSQRPFLRFDDLLGLLIVEPVVRIDDCPAEPLPDDLGLGVHFEHGAEGQLIFMRAQRTKFVGEFFRQHRDGTVHQIDRGTAGEGFLVERRAGRHVVCHVGDVDADLHIPVFQFAVRKGVVEVLGVGRVDGKRGYVAEIPASRQFFRGDGVRDLVGCLLHFRLEAVGQLVFSQDGVHLGVVLARNAEHIDNPAHRFEAALGPVGHQYRHLDAVGGLLAADFRQLVGTAVDPDVIRHVLAFHNGPDLTATHDQDTDMRLVAAPDDLDHFAFQAAAFRPGLDPTLGYFDFHEVAIQGEMQFAHRDEDVFRTPLYFDEAKAVARQ